jgi:hypothetical protein
MTIEQALYEKLTGESTITDVVGSRIYHGWLKNDSVLPAISFFRMSSTPLASAGANATTWSVDIQIDIWHKTQTEARTLADIVSGILRGWTADDPDDAGPWKLAQDRDNLEEAINGENYGYGHVSQDYSFSYTQ